MIGSQPHSAGQKPGVAGGPATGATQAPNRSAPEATLALAWEVCPSCDGMFPASRRYCPACGFDVEAWHRRDRPPMVFAPGDKSAPGRTGKDADPFDWRWPDWHRYRRTVFLAILISWLLTIASVAIDVAGFVAATVVVVLASTVAFRIVGRRVPAVFRETLVAWMIPLYIVMFMSSAFSNDDMDKESIVTVITTILVGGVFVGLLVSRALLRFSDPEETVFAGIHLHTLVTHQIVNGIHVSDRYTYHVLGVNLRTGDTEALLVDKKMFKEIDALVKNDGDARIEIRRLGHRGETIVDIRFLR